MTAITAQLNCGNYTSISVYSVLTLVTRIANMNLYVALIMMSVIQIDIFDNKYII